ncbi:Crp/Fnr family transcriptional regulator [Enterococcus sp. BWB1-3]|uniref:Crp/Fnr family transcriptional regulator n=1 Tax=unclassified Enterococcus TaxID=2608891 RepID=UPI00192351BC|nr:MULTISPECIES: Crp/Fnr family transcriptional regulator [unclassified Enterococcus]MBL1228453.1 Crp/Fnr family transcriptional regulator [Enterococcus sp. BWB1-3]MCB5950458.1 Crp/Fnr family transcriptional regulator [Enterococcus sp. BWT-B8]MCB5954341.1 Crp/Fnr family transcriptional regulator [Enterococcus sp. CWB-B31]
METNDRAKKQRITSEYPYFSVLDNETQGLLIENMYCRSYKKGQILFFTDDKRDRIFFLNKGLVRLERSEESAVYNFLGVIGEKRLFPLLGLFESEKYYFSAVAATDIEVCYIPAVLFEKIVQMDVWKLKLITADLNVLLKKQVRRIQYCTTSKAKQRVKNTLAILMEDLGQQDDDRIIIPHPIMINDLSKLSGTTRETVGQTLRELVKKRKIIYEYKQFTFLDGDYFKLGK